MADVDKPLLSILNRLQEKPVEVTRGTPLLLIAALHLVFVSIRRRFTATQLQSLVLWRRSTGSRPCGGPAIMTMHPVNGGVGFPGMAAMGGVRDITATEDDDGGFKCFVRGRWPSHRSLVSESSEII